MTTGNIVFLCIAIRRHHAVRLGFGMGFVDGRACEEAEIGERAV